MILGLGLSVILAAAAAEVPVTQQGHVANPSWSPDGKWLAFELNSYGGSVELYLVKIQGGSALGAPTEVTIPGATSSFSSGGSIVAGPTWHPRGLLIFEGSNEGGTSRLYFMTPEGAAAQQLLSVGQIAGDLSWPAVSPDGRYVAFVSDSSGSGDLFQWDRTSNTISRLMESPFSEMAPRYDDAGSKMAFSRKNRGSEDLFSLAGGQSVPLIGGNGDQTRPVWAGSDVVFFSNERGADHWDIVVSGGAGNKKVVAQDVRLPMRSTPALSPDKRWVAYGVEDPTNYDKIQFTRLDGSATVSYPTGHVAVGEPCLVNVGGRIYLAYTALPSAEATWRQLHVVDVTSVLD